jgi:hypothetical protein
MAACSFSSSRLWARTAARDVVGGVDPLVVPVDGLELLLDRGDGPVPVDGRLRMSSCGSWRPSLAMTVSFLLEVLSGTRRDRASPGRLPDPIGR